ncbi:MAG: hypothetical protein AAF570_24090, partial [Bacteroidota bacterium]
MLAFLVAGFPHLLSAQIPGQEFTCGHDSLTQAALAARPPLPLTPMPNCWDSLARDSFSLPIHGGLPAYGDPMDIHLRLHVFRTDEGVGPQVADVEAMMNKLNSDFAASGIQFCYSTRFIDNTDWVDKSTNSTVQSAVGPGNID